MAGTIGSPGLTARPGRPYTAPMKAWILGVVAVTVGAGCGGDDGAAGPDAGPLVDAGPGPVDDLAVQAGEPLPAGAWLLMNEWQADPNRVSALAVTDLAGATRTVFSANRVWSLGARADGRTIVFSSHDPQREQAFGINFTDSIQNPFAYDTQTGAVTLLAPAGSGWANVNDECLVPSADGASVYVCRRYDFTADGTFLGWRLGRITLADGSFTFLRPDAAGGPFELSPVELPGGDRVLFELRARPPASGVALHIRTLSTGAETMLRASARKPVLAPDGHRLVFADTTDQSRLKMLDLDAPATAPIAVSPTLDVGDVVWSPDGTTLVYNVYDQPQNCDHLERVTWTGTAWSAPTRVRDCAVTGEFITNLAWVTVP